MKNNAPIVNAFLHDSSSTISYLVVDEVTKSVALIDPVADYDISTGKMAHSFSDKIVNKIRSCNYSLDWIIEGRFFVLQAPKNGKGRGAAETP